METHFDRRALIAIRSLDPSQRADIESVVDNLARAGGRNWTDVVEAVPLQVMDGEQMYSIPAGDELRILSKVISNSLIVQDIFARERLEQISGKSL